MHNMYNLQPNIILIDDDRDDLEILSTILEEKKHQGQNVSISGKGIGLPGGREDEFGIALAHYPGL